MIHDALYRIEPGGITHRALVLSDDLGIQEIRTACGLSVRLWSGDHLESDAEVTCPICRRFGEGSASTPKKTTSHRRLPRSADHSNHLDNGHEERETPTRPPRKHQRRAISSEAVLPLPYGIFDVSPQLTIDRRPPERIRCCVRGCSQLLIPPSRYRPGELCPEHGIWTHSSGTYSYQDPRRNTIIAPDLLTRIIHHPFKFESHRFGYERGEDVLSFNVLRSFQEAGCLHLIARFITGQVINAEPRLFLWGLDFTNNSLCPWDLLIAARERFEARLPVKRPATEPDIALFEPGEFLILCEAKFCSENPVYRTGPRKDKQSLTKDELTAIYTDPALQIIDLDKARTFESIPYQLFRNLQFAEYMARLDSPHTIPFLANLTRQGYENASFEQFFRLIRPEYANQAVHLFWEQLFVLAGLSGGRLSRLQRYLLTKTANLRPAFQLGYF